VVFYPCGEEEEMERRKVHSAVTEPFYSLKKMKSRY
jgi:hypothetical protein